MYPSVHISRLVRLAVGMLVLLAACGMVKQPAQAPAPTPQSQSATTSTDDRTINGESSVDTDLSADEATESEAGTDNPNPLPAATPIAREETAAYAPSDGVGGEVKDNTGDSAEMEEETLADTADSDEEAPTEYPSVASAPVRPRPQGVPAPLKAGERDDNAQFDDYLNYQGEPALVVDVSERYIITILDKNQHPVLDATVRIFADDTEVFVGRTYAGGETLFLPHVRGVSANATAFRIEAEKAGTRVVDSFERGERTRIELVLDEEILLDTLPLDVLFLLDTTGSMGDELTRIQETIDSIAQRIDSFTPRPSVRFGLVAYRDRGDAYITQSSDFTADVVAFRKELNTLRADGGGDTPESLNAGLHEAIQGVQWTDNAVRIVFLVADAGPHLDYEEDTDYIQEAQMAVTKGVKIYPIAASNTEAYAEYVFRQLAQQTLARFIFLTYQPGESGGAPGETTTLQSGDEPYTIARLDDLIVHVIQQELAAAKGAH